MHCLAEPARPHTHTPTHIFLPRCLSAQILTAQFRQMEQELAEAVRRREEDGQQWAEQAGRADAELAALRSSLEAMQAENAELARQGSELVSLKEAEHVGQEALEKEKAEVARLETELALTKEAEIAAVRAGQEASERDRAEIDRLQHELTLMREAAERASQDTSEREKSEAESLEQEREDVRKNEEILARIWRQLQPKAAEEEVGEVEAPVPADPSVLVHTVQSIQDQLMKLRAEHGQTQERCDELYHNMETLQGKKKKNQLTESCVIS